MCFPSQIFGRGHGWKPVSLQVFWRQDCGLVGSACPGVIIPFADLELGRLSMPLCLRCGFVFSRNLFHQNCQSYWVSSYYLLKVAMVPLGMIFISKSGVYHPFCLAIAPRSLLITLVFSSNFLPLFILCKQISFWFQ